MKKIFLLITAAIAAFGMNAAPVDATAAQGVARQFMQSLTVQGRLKKAPASTSVSLIYTASRNNLPLYYIFNTSDSYIIVSGDTRAQEVLAYGDAPMNMANMPVNMREWLNGYGEQIAYIIAHPEKFPEGAQPARRTPYYGATSIDPLLTETWGQSEPYWKYCPEIGGELSVTGCCATSLSMAFHHWKYPAGLNGTMPEYSPWGSDLVVPALGPITFDWDNMLDHYYPGQYNTAQADAVAWLMRYVGHAERMDYSPSGSGSSTYNILRAVQTFGYDEDATMVSKEEWGWPDESGQWPDPVEKSDEEWGAIMLDELEQGRPIVFTGSSATVGHAFNVDGYDAVENKFHINWGWDGSGNGFCAVSAFNGGGMGFNHDQSMVIGIMPPPTTPTLKVRSHRVIINAFVDQQGSGTFTVKGTKLTGDATLTLDDPTGYFTIDTDHLSSRQLANQNEITVTYNPTEGGTHIATVTVTSPGAPEHTVTICGTATIDGHTPVLTSLTGIGECDVEAQWSDDTESKYVSNYCMEVARIPYYDWRFGETFAATTAASSTTSDISSRLDELTDNPGWTGSKVYLGNGYLRLGNANTKGWLETPALDMHGNNGLITVKVCAAAPTSDNSALLNIACAGNDTTITLTTDTTEYCVLLPCPEGTDARVRLTNSPKGKRAMIYSVDIFAGDDFSPIDHSKSTFIDGITDMNYTVTDLQSGFYSLRVQANYIDGTKSDWSNSLRIIIGGKNKADVNGDGEVNIADVNAVIDAILSGNAGGNYDVNGDGEVNIADVNAIIDIILG